MKNKEIEVYLDKIDWDHEVGEAPDGNRIYPSVVDLKREQTCVVNGCCGIVKCKISLVEIIEESDFSKGRTYNSDELKKDFRKLQLEASYHRLEYLEKLVAKQKNKIKKLKGDING